MRFPVPADRSIVSVKPSENDAGIVVVADDGVGLVEPATTKSHGVGLVKRLMEQIGGSATFRSDQGTEWTLRFPLAPVSRNGALGSEYLPRHLKHCRCEFSPVIGRPALDETVACHALGALASWVHSRASDNPVFVDHAPALGFRLRGYDETARGGLVWCCSTGLRPTAA